MMIRVSIIDPNRRMRESLAAAIAQQASGVLCLHKHATASEAMPYLAKDLPDILLVDIDRPGRGGIGSLVSLKTAHPPLIVVVLTSREDNHEVLEALRNGAIGCLLKTATKTEIISAIKHAYHGGSPLPLAVARQMLPLLQRDRPPAPQVLTLSPKEEKIVKLLAQGLHYKEIAASLVLSSSTVRAHLHTIYNKLKVRSRAEAVVKYMDSQLESRRGG